VSELKNNDSRLNNFEDFTKYQTISRRIIAGIIDTNIILIYNIIVIILLIIFRTKYNFLIFNLISILSIYAYTIIMTKKYGATIGKILSGVEVVDYKSEMKINWSQSIRRELINILSAIFYISSILYFTILNSNISSDLYLKFSEENIIIKVIDNIFNGIIFLELFTSLFSKKRRAIHDLLGSTVVIIKKDKNVKFLFLSVILFIILIITHIYIFRKL
jgi:uncharacterized RDD family membrane protein YckC